MRVYSEEERYSFPAWLRQKRETIGLNKTQMAKKVGISGSTYYRIESGYLPSDSLISRIVEKLGEEYFITASSKDSQVHSSVAEALNEDTRIQITALIRKEHIFEWAKYNLMNVTESMAESTYAVSKEHLTAITSFMDLLMNVPELECPIEVDVHAHAIPSLGHTLPVEQTEPCTEEITGDTEQQLIEENVESFFNDESLRKNAQAITNDEKEEPVLCSSSEAIENGLETDDSANDANDTWVGPLQRKLVGGIIIDGKKTIWVPETFIRNNDLYEGDFVRAENERSVYGKFHYDFSIERRINQSVLTNRIELNFVKVSMKHHGLYIAREYYDGRPIVVDGESMQFELPLDDIHNLDITDGDIVTIAYYDNNLDAIRIPWKYSMDELTSLKTMISTKSDKPTQKTKRRIEDENSQINELAFEVDDLAFLNGKKVLIIDGSENTDTSYLRIFRDNGAEATLISCDAHAHGMVSKIKRVDIVVFNIGCASHDSMKLVKKTCKALKIPIAFCKQAGTRIFLDECIHMLKDNEEKVPL